MHILCFAIIKVSCTRPGSQPLELLDNQEFNTKISKAPLLKLLIVLLKKFLNKVFILILLNSAVPKLLVDLHPNVIALR